jgi:hypothetical protein
MSYAENIRVTTEFAETWTSTPHSRRVEEIISVHQESHHYVDRYTYHVDDVGLFMWVEEEDGTRSKVVIYRSNGRGCI